VKPSFSGGTWSEAAFDLEAALQGQVKSVGRRKNAYQQAIAMVANEQWEGLEVLGQAAVAGPPGHDGTGRSHR